MSVTPELIKSKLSSLDSTQESIVSVSSWLLFHKRSAKTIVDVWAQAVKDGSSNRKLSLIYLANEVSQQSRAKKRVEYPQAFSKVMPGAIENVFRHATSDVQSRIVRVVDVWKQRSIFPPEVLTEITKRLDSKAPAQAAPQKSMSVPPELTNVANTYTKILGSSSSSSLTLGTAENLYANLIDVEPSQRPSLELYTAKLAQLSKSLDSAQKSVSLSISLREELAQQLRNFEQMNTTALDNDRNILSSLAQKEAQVRIATQEAQEDALRQIRSTTPEMAPPQVEALTPPAAFTLPDVPVQPMSLDPATDVATSNDPVARLQMELDPSITELLARQDAMTNEPMRDEEVYVP